MTNTTYYNLNIVEGTDIVNPLIVDNPNYEKIDEVMHDNAVSGVTMATEIANATVHAITRENSECAVIRFIATSVWKAGDTVTVDGVPVTALLPSGETLPDGAYVINANVLCILTGTNLTVYVERKKINDASDIKYNDTNVAEALTSLNSDLSKLKKANIKNISTWYPEGFEVSANAIEESDGVVIRGTVYTKIALEANTAYNCFGLSDYAYGTGFFPSNNYGLCIGTTGTKSVNAVLKPYVEDTRYLQLYACDRIDSGSIFYFNFKMLFKPEVIIANQ